MSTMKFCREWYDLQLSLCVWKCIHMYLFIRCHTLIVLVTATTFSTQKRINKIISSSVRAVTATIRSFSLYLHLEMILIWLLLVNWSNEGFFPLLVPWITCIELCYCVDFHLHALHPKLKYHSHHFPFLCIIVRTTNSLPLLLQLQKALLPTIFPLICP